MILVNPEIIKWSGKITIEEGCLSFPSVSELITRSHEVTALATDIDGQKFELKAGGYLSVAIQHEIDHLNGVLIIDRMRYYKKTLVNRCIAGNEHLGALAATARENQR